MLSVSPRYVEAGLLILAVDTAGAACSAALARGPEVVAARREPMTHGHAVRLVPLLSELMAEAGLGWGQLDLFAVTTGPGGFTGLRIGLATVGGLALAAGRPILGIDSFDATVHGLDPAAIAGRPVLAVLDSRREALFARAFAGDLTPRGEPACLPPAALPPLIGPGPVALAGDAARAALPVFGSRAEVLADGPVDPTVLARLAWARRALASDAWPRPLYLRAPDFGPPART